MSKSDASPSLFGDSSAGESAKLRIVHARFVDHSRASIEDLISGYSSMRVLTYSSSISIVDRVARVLKDLEIVFGREDIIRGMSPYFAFQRALVEGLRTEVKGKDLLERKISSGNVRVHVVTGSISHEKLFLLKGERHQGHHGLGQLFGVGALRGPERELHLLRQR